MKNRKSLGQHWLKDRNILNEIAYLSRPDLPPRDYTDGLSTKILKYNNIQELSKFSTLDSSQKKSDLICIEIGPGLGTLTSSLFRQYGSIIAIELDDNLSVNLSKSFPGKNLIVENISILDYDFDKITTSYVIAGNIPYYITKPIIRKIIELKNPPQKTTLLIQKEVALDISATKGSHSFFSIFVQNFAKVQAEFIVPPEYFTPPPKVDSAVITLIPRQNPLLPPEVIKFITQYKGSLRKKLYNNLSKEFNAVRLDRAFEISSIDKNVRFSDLAHIDWQNLFAALKLA